MKFVFVVGGSYKGFYLNKLNRIKYVDLLIFHQNIFYEFDYEQEQFYDAPVSKELISLNEKLKCPILVYGVMLKDNIRTKCFILCVYGKVSIIDCDKDIYLYIKNKPVFISNKIYRYLKGFASILFVEDNRTYHNLGENYPQNYFLCYKNGVTCIKNGKINRKFRKCCYFTLNFKKKML